MDRVAHRSVPGDDWTSRQRGGGREEPNKGMGSERLSPRVRAFLDERRFACLATINADGSPQQTVIWYLLRDGKIMMNTRRGRTKDRNLVRDPRASICVEDGDRYVSIAGTVEMIDEQASAQADIKTLATRYDGPERAEELMRDAFGKQERITLLLSIDHVIAAGFDE
jgi:PPOX class probable F420-dependent enzyme